MDLTTPQLWKAIINIDIPWESAKWQDKDEYEMLRIDVNDTK